MRQSFYELSLVGKDGTPFKEREIDGKYYVRAEPGIEYDVKFAIYPDAGGNFQLERVICILTIDGNQIDSGYYQNLCSVPTNQPYVFMFRGTQVSADTVQSFQFSAVKVSSASQTEATASINTPGELRVDVYEAHRTERAVPTTMVFKPTVPSMAANTTENKKFWQQPSLATTNGTLRPQMYVHPEYFLEKLRTTPDAALGLQYHAADVLDILQDIHNKKNAPPAIILPPLHIDLSTEPDPVPAQEPEPAVVLDLRLDEAAKKPRVVLKVEKKRKRRKLDHDVDSPDVIDLT